MSEILSMMAGAVIKITMALVAANEIRGLIMAAPVLYAMYQAGGTLMAIWLGISSLGGIVASVVAPLLIAQKLNNKNNLARS